MSGSSVTFYPMGNMRQAQITSVTNAAAGFPKENMVDFNPDTYWKQSGNVAHTILINLGAVKQGDSVIYLIRDFLTDHSTKTIEIRTDDDDDGLYTPTTIQDSDFLPAAGTQQIAIYEIDTPLSKQYWLARIVLSGGAVQAPQLAGLFICRKYTIAQAAQWPEADVEKYHNRIITSSGGRQFAQGINLNKQERFRRTYRLGETDMATLKSVFNDCKGRLFPLILQEGSSNADARLVHFASDSLVENQLDYQLYEPTVEFVQIPFIGDGESY